MLLLATLLGLIFAVLAMHGLTSHERGHSHHTAAAVPLPGDATEVEHAQAHHAPDADPPAPDRPEPERGGGASERFLTLLSLVTAMAAWVLRLGSPRRVLYVARRWTHQGRAPLGRNTDAPCLHRLSVLRC